MHFGGRAWWTGWWTGCWGKGRTRQWSLGLWPEQLGRCEATGPDEENQERNQYHRDSFILYLIYFPQQHSSFAIFIPTLRKRKLRLSEMKLLVQAHRGLGGNRRERFFFFLSGRQSSIVLEPADLSQTAEVWRLPLPGCDLGQVSWLPLSSSVKWG